MKTRWNNMIYQTPTYLQDRYTRLKQIFMHENKINYRFEILCYYHYYQYRFSHDVIAISFREKQREREER